MAKNPGAALRKVGGAERSPAPRSVVGDEITRHLRELQAQRRQEFDVDATLAGMVPAIATLAERGLLVSVAVTPDKRSLRVSALIDKEWVPWYAEDQEAAEELAAAIVAVFRE